jgi:ABC-type transporter Mla subunit MlaD
MRDQFNLSGDFRGALVNINSSLDRAHQSVNASSAAFSDVAAKLDELLEQLRAELRTVGPEHHEAAETLAASTALVIETASSATSNPTLIRAGARSVLDCGKTLLKTFPAIASTVKNILDVAEKVATLAGK